MAVKIMMDSASDMPQAEAKELGIKIMPLTVQFGDEEYIDGVNLSPSEFYTKLEESKIMPKTSLVNEYTWGEAFREATADGNEVVAVILSSTLSGTYRAAENAAKEFEGKVFVVDSLSGGFGVGILGMYAYGLAKKGLHAAEIAKLCEEKKKNIRIFAVIDTLKYLKKGGRISTAAAFVAESLSIKLMASVIDGEVKVYGKTLGRKKANLNTNKSIADVGGIDFDMPISYFYSGNDTTNLNNFINDIAPSTQGAEIPTYVLGATIGTHVGPGAVGIMFFKKD